MKRLIGVLCMAGLLRGGFAAPQHTFEVSMERDAFLLDGRGIMIFKPSRVVEAEAVIRANNLHCLSEKDLPLH